jgi:hypothetical protein
MPVKTDWTNGDILTASQVSTYLANSGLEFIKEVFVGESSVTQVKVEDVFSAAYTNYKIVYQGIDTSIMTVIKFEFLDANGDPVTTDYSSVAMQMNFGGTTITGEQYGYWYVAAATGAYQFGSFDLYAPFRDDTYTYMAGDTFSSSNYRHTAGKYGMQASFTDFRFVGDPTGFFQMGSIAVYGYRLT